MLPHLMHLMMVKLVDKSCTFSWLMVQKSHTDLQKTAYLALSLEPPANADASDPISPQLCLRRGENRGGLRGQSCPLCGGDIANLGQVSVPFVMSHAHLKKEKQAKEVKGGLEKMNLHDLGTLRYNYEIKPRFVVCCICCNVV